MQAASFIAGIIFFVLSTISRWLSQKSLLTRGQHIRLFTIPSIENQGDAFSAVGQVMGILWIGVGIILSQNEEWLSSSSAGIIVEPLVAFVPFLIGGIIIRLLTAKNKDKGA